MSEHHWEFYPTQMGEHTAFVFVNLTIGEELADRGRTGQVLARVQLKHPREDGLTTNAEFQSLSDLEDAFNNYCATADADMVGRITVAGFRDFVIYTADAEKVCAGLTTIAHDEHGYEIECLTREDPEFEVYWQHLYPTPIDLRLIHDRQVIDHLEELGDPCTEPRQIDHLFWFAEADPRDAMQKRLEIDGFKTLGIFAPTEERPEHGLEVCKDGVPSLEEVCELTVQLVRLAEEFDGTYDGWGTTALTPDAPEAEAGSS